MNNLFSCHFIFFDFSDKFKIFIDYLLLNNLQFKVNHCRKSAAIKYLYHWKIFHLYNDCLTVIPYNT